MSDDQEQTTIERRPLGWAPQLWIRSLGRALLTRRKREFHNGIVPSTVRKAFLKRFQASIVADKETLASMLARSTDDCLRPVIREFDANHTEQLTWKEWVRTFPEDERATAEQFGARRLYDPRFDQHRRPQDMGPSGLRRAAEFLEQHGKGELREAQVARDLADIREGKGWNDDDDGGDG